jgi:aspartyl-tRNA(Asn)/glutamyl-tRNA(Gln) amidotransferase subunit A
VIILEQKMIERSIGELAPLIQSRSISPVKVTDALLDQIDTYNKRLNAYIEVTQKEEKEAAQNKRS